MIYLVKGNELSFILILKNLKNMDREKTNVIVGGGIEIYEIGDENNNVPPGALLIGKSEELTMWRPLGKKVS
jgi:hypothetical protein